MISLPRALRTATSPKVSALALMLVAAPACYDSGAAPRIVSVTPGFAFSDGDVTLTVDAPGTRPSLLVDLESQSPKFELTSVQLSLVPSDPDGRVSVPLLMKDWMMKGQFLASIGAGVAAGEYDVKLVAPNGQTGKLERAFVCGGARPDGPTVLVSSPNRGQMIGAGDEIRAAFTIDDYGGQLVDVSWRTSTDARGACALPPDELTGDPPASFDTTSDGDCAIIPTPPAASFTTSSLDFGISITATDVSGHFTTIDVPLIVAQTPVITGFKNLVGRLEGRQEFTVTGRYFPPDAEASIGGVRILDPDTFMGTGGRWLNETTIVGLTPPNKRPEMLDVAVSTTWGAIGTATTAFRYTLPPLIRVIQPSTGPAAGGTRMTIVGNDLRSSVRIKFGVSLEGAKDLQQEVKYEADAKVTGFLPPGHGTVSVWAVDDITGIGQAVNGFTYIEDGTGALLDPVAPAASDALVTAPGVPRPKAP